jgi:hypothetical protein
MAKKLFPFSSNTIVTSARPKETKKGKRRKKK